MVDTKAFLVMGDAEKAAWLMEDRDEQILTGNGVFMTRNHTVMSLCYMWTYKLSLAEYPTLHNLCLLLKKNFSAKNASITFSFFVEESSSRLGECSAQPGGGVSIRLLSNPPVFLFWKILRRGC